MDEFKNVLSHDAVRVKQYVISFIQWILFAALTGFLGGGIGAAFRYSIDFVTGLRTDLPWLCYLLPLGGLVIAFLYRVTKLSGHADTNLIINSVRTDGRLPILLAPVIFVSTVLTHLFGGSAGREGAALQLGGTIGSFFGRLFRLGEKDMHMAIMCGMSGLFSALFGTPLTATIFAMEVISVGIMYYSAFVPCLISALTAFWTTKLFGLSPTAFSIDKIPSLDIMSVLLTAVIGVGCAIVSILFCLALKWSHKLAVRFFKNEYLRLSVGGTAIVIMTLLIGTRYSGAGTDIIDLALSGKEVLPYDFILKIIFTAITIGFGYKGGEIVPTIFIGATFGSLVGTLIGLPPAFAAAVGMIALFCAVVNCPIASIILSIEMFGAEGLVLFAVAVCISFMLSGYYGLYTGQKIIYSKRRTRFINRNVK
ncbi:H+/Cl-antiporter ClcA [Ruminococcaceae bacterium P7]|nr:chloride channel protein [uncultured Ruminococcus sp.]SCX16081.1 H+/Cl-antiporter ClcA [Ruminococcaceae bacterium P7]